MDGSEPFAEMSFECYGDDEWDVDGEFLLRQGADGSCDGTDEQGVGYNMFMVQLAVLCRSENVGYFMTDDYYADCGNNNTVLLLDDLYTCYTGTACHSDVCQVAFTPLIIHADPHRFPGCIQTSDGTPVSHVQEPALPPMEAGIYKASFQTVWEADFQDGCSGGNSTKLIRITCTNGSIRLKQSLVSDKACSAIDDSAVECLDDSVSGEILYVSYCKCACEIYLLRPLTFFHPFPRDKGMYIQWRDPKHQRFHYRRYAL